MWICIFFFFLPKERKKYLKRWYLFLQARSKWNKVLGHTNTRWIHGVDWWLWKCRIISKVHNLVQTHCTDWAKNQTPLAWFETLAKASSPAQVQLDKKSLPLWSLFTAVIYTNVGLCPGRGRGSRPRQAHLLPIPLDILLLEICTNQLQALWNVFGWNKPTLQGNGFTEC